MSCLDNNKISPVNNFHMNCDKSTSADADASEKFNSIGFLLAAARRLPLVACNLNQALYV